MRDIQGVTKEEMGGTVSESWIELRDADPRPPEVDMLAAHDAVTTNSRKAQHTLGKLVNQGRHALRTQLR